MAEAKFTIVTEAVHALVVDTNSYHLEMDSDQGETIKVDVLSLKNPYPRFKTLTEVVLQRQTGPEITTDEFLLDLYGRCLFHQKQKFSGSDGPQVPEFDTDLTPLRPLRDILSSRPDLPAEMKDRLRLAFNLQQ